MKTAIHTMPAMAITFTAGTLTEVDLADHSTQVLEELKELM